MGLKGKIASIMGTAVLAMSMGATTLAQENGETAAPVDVDVEVDPATDAALTWTISEAVPFDAVQFSFDEQTTTGTLTITVTDNRGTRAGWDLSISGDDFTGVDEDNPVSIPIGGLALQPQAVAVVTGQADPLPQGSPVTAVSTTASPIISVPEGGGSGQYTMDVNGTLTIPGDTPVDTYTTTLTVTETTGP